MNTRLIISLLCAGALAFACGPRTRADTSVALASMLPVGGNPVPELPRRVSNLPARVKLDARFSVDVAPNSAAFSLVVRNLGGKHGELNFSDGQSYDFVVLDANGHEVWQWSDGRIFTQIVQNKQLGSGESIRIAETWKGDRVKPGHYTVIATLKSSNYPVEQRASFVIP